ncbi:MAG: DUF441 domain-containing protein [Clostridiales bacterium]|nr:DUF441 domain-containing protein [Clostridiales bacterium]MCF8022772.1 DUF441 domain-containing protein [Clostridiales bacterium]
MSGVPILIALLVIGVLARSNIIAVSACILLLIKFARLDFLLPMLEKRGLELGLVFLLLSILVPIATGKVTEKDLLYNLTSLPGLIAIIGGAMATHMNQEGLKLLEIDPELIFGLIVGSIFGIVCFGGVPVGPLMSAGLAAFFLQIINFIKH